MKFSRFGQRFTRPAGAVELMTDLGAAMAADIPPLMLGGGNPAHIPEMLAVFRERFHAVLDDDRDFRRLVADYPDPAGEQTFRAALAGLLRRECGWDVGPENIALTAGSQQGFFLLFNLLAGPSAAGAECGNDFGTGNHHPGAQAGEPEFRQAHANDDVLIPDRRGLGEHDLWKR